jgi:transposase
VSEVYDVSLRDDIRDWVLVQGHSQRSAAKQFAVSRDTVGRMLLEAPQLPERRYQRGVPFPTPVRDLVLPHIEGWLQENARLQRWAPKQRWTAHRMWVELHQMGVVVAESTVRQRVRERKIARREISQAKAYVPLAFAPAERGEVDFGHALVRLAGEELQVPFLAARLRYCGAMFVAAFPTERQDAFLLGQRWAFEFWGGVPKSVVYDNLEPAVSRLLRGHSRQEQQAFWSSGRAAWAKRIYLLGWGEPPVCAARPRLPPNWKSPSNSSACRNCSRSTGGMPSSWWMRWGISPSHNRPLNRSFNFSLIATTEPVWQ